MIAARYKGSQGPGREEHRPRPRNQLALEIDHFATCARDGRQPHTPGEEGLQDPVLMEATYRAAAERHPMALRPPPTPTRGPHPGQG